MERAVRHLGSALLLGLVLLGGCSRDNAGSLGRLPSDRHRTSRVPVLDGGVPFDFRWVRIDAAPHVGQTRICDVTFVGARETVTRRTERRYGDRQVVERVSIRCGTPDGESWVDLIFPPEASGFASTVHVGNRVLVEVLQATGGFEDATVAEFRAVASGADSVSAPAPEPTSVPAAFDFRQVDAHPELVGRVHPCSVAWVGPIERIAEEAKERYPRGATHRVSVSCEAARGESSLDVVASARLSPDLLRIVRGARIRLRILAARGGTDDVPITRLEP